MRVAITGASGFVGKLLVSRLCADGIKVTALENKTPLTPHDNLKIIQGSLTDGRALPALVAEADVVVHCGGLVAARKAEEFYRINTQATDALIKACEVAGVKRFLYISSLAAREPHLSDYALSKRQAEALLGTEVHFKWDILRPPAIYGPEDRQIFKIIKDLNGGLGVIPKDEDARLSVIYRDDIVSAIIAWIKSDQAGQGRIYELDDGYEGGYGWRDLMNGATKALGNSPFILCAPKFLLSTVAMMCELYAYCRKAVPYVSRDKISEMYHPDWRATGNFDFSESYGWQPEVILEKGMQDTVAWYRTQGWL